MLGQRIRLGSRNGVSMVAISPQEARMGLFEVGRLTLLQRLLLTIVAQFGKSCRIRKIERQRKQDRHQLRAVRRDHQSLVAHRVCTAGYRITTARRKDRRCQFSTRSRCTSLPVTPPTFSI